MAPSAPNRPRPEALEKPDFSNNSHTDSRNWNDRSSLVKAANLNKLIRQALEGCLGGRQSVGMPYDMLLADMKLDDIHPGMKWTAERFLGEGGFGRVCLFQCRDEEGVVVDEIAIKEIAWLPELDIANRDGLCQEAAINRDLNTQDEHHRINYLRRFRFSHRSAKQRVYMICAPYGDLQRLKARYMLFDAYIPELFLWDCLIQLCQGLEVLEKDPPDDSVVVKWTEDNARIQNHMLFTLHLDIKPRNIFLDYERETKQNTEDVQDEGLPIYPTIRIGDFGLAQYTGASDPMNPEDYRPNGTRYFYPPEQTKWRSSANSRWGADPTNPPSDHFGPPHNVWCIGREVYNDLDHHFLDEHWHNVLCYWTNWTDARASFPYTQPLLDLVSGALKPEIQDRSPTALLLEAAMEGSQDYLAELRAKRSPKGGTLWNKRAAVESPLAGKGHARGKGKGGNPERPSGSSNEGDDDSKDGQGGQAQDQDAIRPGSEIRDPDTWEEATRLYFRENEINEMKSGPANFHADFCSDKEYKRQIQWCPPQWPTLRGPAKRWGNVQPQKRMKIPDLVVEEVVRFARDKKRWEGMKAEMEQRATKLREMEAGGVKGRGTGDYDGMDGVEVMQEIKRLQELSKGGVEKLMDGKTVVQLREYLRELEGKGGQENEEERDQEGINRLARGHNKPPPKAAEYRERILPQLREDLQKRTNKDTKKFRLKWDVIRELMRLDKAGIRGDEKWRDEPRGSRRGR